MGETRRTRQRERGLAICKLYYGTGFLIHTDREKQLYDIKVFVLFVVFLSSDRFLYSTLVRGRVFFL